MINKKNANKKLPVFKPSDCAILILSCDKYADMWEPFFIQFHTMWPDCPFKIYLGSNTKTRNHASVRTILSGKGRDWSSDLLSILEQLKEKYIFVWLEDLFPTAPVDTKVFLRVFRFMHENHANQIHIAPTITPDALCKDTLFGSYAKGAPYRVTAPGFWNKQHLQKLLLPGEDPWRFEIMGSYRSSYFDGYYTITKPLFQIMRVVDKGKIRWEAYQYCNAHNITLDTSKRPVNTRYEAVRGDLSALLFNSFLRIPWKKRVTLMEAFRRLFVSY